MKLGLRRISTGDDGTRGVLILPNGIFCATLELPWRGNKVSVSCIPTGEYTVQSRISPRFGKVYHVQDVPGRTWIEFHAGNLAGDTSLGFLTHTEGCILLGSVLGRLYNQAAVLNSRPTVQRFMDALEGNPFTLLLEDETCYR